MTAIRDAFVLASPADANREVVGMPQLVRTLLTLQRAGVERCVVAGRVPAPRDARLRLSVVVDPQPRMPADDDPVLVVGPGTVIDAVLVERLRDAWQDQVIDLGQDGARVRLAPGRRALPLGDVGEAVWKPPGTISPAADPKIAERLLRGLENDRDGYLDRLVYRRLSRPLSRRLLATAIGANTVTLIGVVLGVAGGLLLGVPGPLALVAALLLLLVSGVLDCVDGELARIRFTESRFGHVLDVAGDTVVHLAVLGGIALRLAGQGITTPTATLVVLGVGVLGSFAAITWSEVTEARRRRAARWENIVLDRILSPLTTRDWYVFPIAFAALGWLGALVPAAAAGAHVFWMIVAVLVWRVLRDPATA